MPSIEQDYSNKYTLAIINKEFEVWKTSLLAKICL